jgi:hypothetical protein
MMIRVATSEASRPEATDTELPSPTSNAAIKMSTLMNTFAALIVKPPKMLITKSLKNPSSLHATCCKIKRKGGRLQQLEK